MTKLRRAAFLDRDGVVNRMVYDAEFGTVDSPSNPDQMVLLSGVGSAIAELNRLGLWVVIVSNQPGIAKGKFTHSLLEAMQAKMVACIKADGGQVDAIYNCLHHPQAVVEEFRAECECRKPHAGLLLRATHELQIDLKGSYMVGDGVHDVMAGQAAGVATVFVNSRKCYMCDALAEHQAWPDYMAGDLREAVAVIRQLETGEPAPVGRFAAGCRAAHKT